ncbi:unnamed protein product [Rotaria sp. Silwood1]|nr:unnamed protein product [Rotaria sp. Silwood1]
MATSVSASYSAGDICHEKFRRSIHPHQSIPLLRRERTVIGEEFNRNQQLKPIYSHESPVRSSAFSGEKQYDRRQVPTKVRSAKSDEIFHLIDRKLQTGVHGVRHMFRSNDPNQEGKLSKEAFRRVLMQLCGYINAEEWEKVCKMFHMNERDDTITFQEFLSYFPDNEKVKRELSLAQIDRRSSSLLTLSQNATSSQQSYHKHNLPKLTANYCFSLMKARCRDPSFTPNDYLPYDCLNDGVIIREHLKKILENFQLDDIIDNEHEFEKLWSKFDLNNSGTVRTNVFLRLLNYRVNLADEIDANIQRLVSRSGAAGIVDRRISSSTIVSGLSPSRKQRQLLTNRNRECNENDRQFKHSAPPPTALGESLDETMRTSNEQCINDDDENSNKISSSINLSTRELSTKFRTLVQQHRKMIKQLHETDEFLPFLDRKVNEGYFCLKTVFAYLDSNQTNFISKQQLIAALNQFDIPLSLDNIDQFLQKHHCTTSKTINNENMIDYNAFLKYFQDRSESSFLAHSLNIFTKEKSITPKSDFSNIENGIIDLLHHGFLSLTAAFKYISNDIDDLCPERELFIILKKELGIADNYRFTEKQKNEVYNLLNCTDTMKQKRQLPYKPQRSRSTHDHQIPSTARSIISSSGRAISSSGRISDISNNMQSIDYHEIYNRILPYIRQNYSRIKHKLLENDPTACGLIDFSTLQDIFHHYSVPINDIELGTLIRLDNPHNGSKILYPFFIRKYHPNGPVMKNSPWSRVHPIYEQLIQKQHEKVIINKYYKTGNIILFNLFKHPLKEVYDQRTQNPRDLKYLIRLFTSYDKPRKGIV